MSGTGTGRSAFSDNSAQYAQVSKHPMTPSDSEEKKHRVGTKERIGGEEFAVRRENVKHVPRLASNSFDPNVAFPQDVLDLFQRFTINQITMQRLNQNNLVSKDDLAKLDTDRLEAIVTADGQRLLLTELVKSRQLQKDPGQDQRNKKQQTTDKHTQKESNWSRFSRRLMRRETLTDKVVSGVKHGVASVASFIQSGKVKRDSYAVDNFSCKNPDSDMPVFHPKMVKTYEEVTHKVRVFQIGAEADKKPTKTILVVGATGCGKSTLINSMFNVLLGIKYEDTCRLKLVTLTEEEELHVQTGQHVSQTDWITGYVIPHGPFHTFPYNLKIIDTPGFGDTRSIERDQELFGQLKKFFEDGAKHSITEVDAICFVVQAPNNRLTASQKYIFQSTLSVFGKNVKENFLALITFCDGATPPAIASLDAAEVPYKKYFLFNNSAFFELSKTPLTQMFWELGVTNFNQFFNGIGDMNPTSLLLSRDVLNERELLKCNLAILDDRIRELSAKMNQLDKEKKAMEKHRGEIEQNKDFTIEVEEPIWQEERTPPGTYSTNCQTCRRSCHYPCKIMRDDLLKQCHVMKRGVCNQCQCPVEDHVNQEYRLVLASITVMKTYMVVKERYENAQRKLESAPALIAAVQSSYDSVANTVRELVEKASRNLNRLREIALRPDPLTESDYVEMLIEEEKQNASSGHKQRVAMLNQILNTAQLTAKVQTGQLVTQV